MSRRIRVFLTFAFALAVGGYGFALAQDEGSSTTSDEGDAEAGMDVQQRANLTPEQQLARGHEVVERGTRLSRRIASMLDEARQERDIIRVTCLNDKLTQINANLRTAETRVSALEDAVAAQDSSRRGHEFTVLTVLNQKFQVLERESNECVGEDLFDTGATSVETLRDEGTPDEDPTALPVTEPSIDVLIPPPSSPAI